DQELPFNFAIVSRSIATSHKLHILSAMHSMSRLSQPCAAGPRCPQRVGKRLRLCRLTISALGGSSTVALRATRSTQYFSGRHLLEEFAECVSGGQHGPC